MGKFMSYDPWASVTTRNGIPGDEVISMLQKSIRRGLEKNALYAAYEMYTTSPQFEEKLWRRLQVISVEDIGYGNLHAPELIYTLAQMRKEFPYTDRDRTIFFVHAIRFLCRQQKERSSDNTKNMMIKEFAHGRGCVVPDYAYDLHTNKGREMGRDEIHFLTEASKVSPQFESEELKKVYEEYLAYCNDPANEEGESEVQPFEFNSWQW